jgi:hypothetical protein
VVKGRVQRVTFEALLEGTAGFLEPATFAYACQGSNPFADLEHLAYLVDEKAPRTSTLAGTPGLTQKELPGGAASGVEEKVEPYRFAVVGANPGVVTAARPGCVVVGVTSGIGLGAFDRRPFFTSSITMLLFSRIIPVAWSSCSLA